jgi:hypothetical protein
MIQFIEHVRIDVSQIVARHKQTDEAFKRLYWDMQDRFGDRQYGYRVCLHEAAHAILMEQSGIKNVRFSGPAILFDLEKNPKTGFFPIGAMASGDDTPMQRITVDWILEVLTHIAAGGIALYDYEGVPLENSDLSGADDDYRVFLMRYAALPPALRQEAPEIMWRRVQARASAKLNEAETKAKVLARAKQYFESLYPTRP